MQESLDASLVRIRAPDGRVVGAGFLVGECQVLTCAHVVSQALSLPDAPVDPPQGAVSLDFPRIPPNPLFTARVVQWCPPLPDGSGDIAGLELECKPPTGTEVVRFASAENVWKHDFSALGFPTDFDDGVWATGRLLRRQATNWIQIEDVKAQGFAVGLGFSGTPVWDEQLQGVVGMVVAASRPTETRTAFVIPVDVLVAAWPQLTIPRGEPRNPYKGLRPFTHDDTRDFFGREQVVDKLVETIAQLVAEQPAATSKRLLTILGPSGSGKSSLVMAGLLPRLQQGALPGSEAWTYLEPMVPGKHPLEALILSLAPWFPDRSFMSLREDLEVREARGLHQLAAHLLTTRKGKQPGAKVMLLVDQFEEFFTQTESEDERERFMQLLLVACSEPNGPLLGLLTLRANFYDRPMGYPELYQMIEAHQVALLSMETKDLRRVIEQPAALPDVQLTFEGDLVENLLSEVRGQAGALPLLQFTLHQLFQQRSGRQLTLSAYRELGGVKGALARKAEETYTELPSEEHRRLSRDLFIRLIDPGATEQDTTRRRAALSEFSLAEVSQTRLLQEVADAFIKTRLLTTNEIAGTTTIEVSHEALIREWPRLASWLREAREDIRLQQTISKDAVEWERRNKPGDRLYRGAQFKEAQVWAKRNTTSKQEQAFLQASAARQLRSLIAVIAVILLVVTTSGIAGWFFLNRAPTPDYVTTTDEYTTGSLRWAIGTAHAGETITFDPSLAGRTIVLQNADIHIFQQHLTIQGPTTGRITIREIGAGLIVDKPASVTISGLAFQGRNTKDQPSLILNQGKLTLKDCIISGNTADKVGGGGIENGGTLTVSNSTVSDNTSIGGNGGGIENGGTLTLNNSTVSDNTSIGGPDSTGGGIDNWGTLTVSNSTISGNTAADGGGGIDHNRGTLTVSNSTVSDNTTAGNGGGIWITSGTLTVSNSTISDNTATDGGGILIHSYVVAGASTASTIAQVDLTFSTIYGNTGTAHGSGDIAIEDVAFSSNGNIIKADKQLSQVKISSSIVAGDPAHPGPDISGTLISYGYNLFQDNSGATFDPATRTQHGTDKTVSVNDLTKLFADPAGLRNHGGSTRTYALGPDSPALDQIPLQYCQVKGILNSRSRMYTDQRGVKRPDKNESACDIGAYEYVDSG